MQQATSAGLIRVAGIMAFLAGFLLASFVWAQEDSAFSATLQELNPDLTSGEVSGQAIFIIADGQLHISLIARGFEPGMHLQHIHGFTQGGQSTCPAADADANGDGIVDLLETEPAAGVTLIPFNSAPAELMIESDSYPLADADGLMTYTMTVPLAALESALQDAYKIAALDLGSRVIFIHGVPEGAGLPDTVQSLPGVPAYVTVPLACGEIRAF